MSTNAAATNTLEPVPRSAAAIWSLVLGILSIGCLSVCSTVLPESILIWSAGPDGDFDTWEDNVRSW